jgi:hypothetical protein
MATLAGPQEIAAEFNVTRRTVYQWTARDDFPAPLARLAAGPVYDLDQIRAWRRSDPKARRPYRPRS